MYLAKMALMSNTKAITTKDPKPNPQGKASLAFLQDWQAAQPVLVQPKSPRQIIADYFTSMLVLSANFRFRPVRGQRYYLYFSNQEWNISLISPDEWGASSTRLFVGTCQLQPDMAWTIDIAASLPDPVTQALADAWQAFATRLNTDDDFASTLPTYDQSLSYYSRLHASALSASLKISMKTGGGQTLTSAKDYLIAGGKDLTRLLHITR